MIEQLKWVASAGGPLLCVERDALGGWCGNTGSVDMHGACQSSIETDYDRACAVSGYAGVLDLPQKRSAVVLWGMPLSTTVAVGRDRRPVIIRVFYMEPKDDIDVVERVTQLSLAEMEPIESMAIDVKSGSFIIFDSALGGTEPRDVEVGFELTPSRYQLMTTLVKPKPKTSLVVHWFTPTMQH